MDAARAAPRHTPAHSSQGQQRMQLQSARVKFRAKITRCGTKAMVKEKEATESAWKEMVRANKAHQRISMHCGSAAARAGTCTPARGLVSGCRARRGRAGVNRGHLRDQTFPQQPRDREHRERRWQPPRCRPQHAWERVQFHRRFRRCLRCNCVKGEGKLDLQPARAEADWGGGALNLRGRRGGGGVTARRRWDDMEPAPACN